VERGGKKREGGWEGTGIKEGEGGDRGTLRGKGREGRGARVGKGWKLVMDDFIISKLDRFRFDFLKKI